jgi:hypothetical protein
LSHGLPIDLVNYPNFGANARHFFGRTYVKDFDGFNGYCVANQIDSTSGNRWKGDNVVITELTAPDATDQVFIFGSSGNPDTPSGIKIRRTAVKSTQDPVIESWDTDGFVDWEGVVLSGSADLGFNFGTPTGVTNADAGFVNRGDGLLMPTHSNLDNTTFIDCIPVDLTGPTIANLGVTR